MRAETTTHPAGVDRTATTDGPAKGRRIDVASKEIRRAIRSPAGRRYGLELSMVPGTVQFLRSLLRAGGPGLAIGVSDGGETSAIDQ